jgi:hypothetical protein
VFLQRSAELRPSWRKIKSFHIWLEGPFCECKSYIDGVGETSAASSWYLQNLKKDTWRAGRFLSFEFFPFMTDFLFLFLPLLPLSLLLIILILFPLYPLLNKFDRCRPIRNLSCLLKLSTLSWTWWPRRKTMLHLLTRTSNLLYLHCSRRKSS